MKVYVVSKGEYSDERVEGVYDSSEVADYVAKALDRRRTMVAGG